MARSFDLIVLGAGMAAVSAANKCASAGWSVAIVDELPYGDLVVHGAGRVPAIDGLDLEAADVNRGKRGVAVNEFLQSNVAYGSTDCVSSAAFAANRSASRRRSGWRSQSARS